MTIISTFVFFDIETTGLPWQEKNRTKITELCLLAVNRKDIERSKSFPPVSKLTFILNPERKLQPAVVSLTGLTNEYLKYSPTFAQKSNSIINFLQDLPKPVCLVAHNGNTFDFKILLAECIDAKISLPDDLLCVDSLAGFRTHSKGQMVKMIPSEIDNENILTEDEDVWTELNVTPEDWLEIDDLCNSLIESTCLNESTNTQNGKNKSDNVFTHEVDSGKDFQDLNRKRSAMINNRFSDSNKMEQSLKTNNNETNSYVKQKRKNTKLATGEGSKRVKGQFTLSGIYKTLLNKDFNAHRAEEDCLALLECVMAVKDNFLPWMDGACKSLSEIKPLVRY